MVATQLLPTIQVLPHSEKLLLLQMLVAEICKDESVSPLQMNASYPIWTPFNVPAETVNKLAALLEEDSADD